MAPKTHNKHGLSDYSFMTGKAQVVKLDRDDGQLLVELYKGCAGYSVRTSLNGDTLYSVVVDSLVEAREVWHAEVNMRCGTQLRAARGHQRHIRLAETGSTGAPFQLNVGDEFHCLADTRLEAWAEGYNQLRKLGWLSKSASN